MNLSVKKIELILPQRNINKTLEKLQEQGILEVIPTTDSGEDSSESLSEDIDGRRRGYQLELSEVNFAFSFLEKFKKKENFLKNLISSFVPLKKIVKQENLEKIIQCSKTKEVIKSCALIEEKINKLETKKNQLSDEITILNKFQETSVVAGKKLNKIDYFAGSISLKEKESFLKELSKRKNFYLEKAKEDSFIFNFVIFYFKNEKDFYSEILKKHQAKEEIVFWQIPAKENLEKNKKEKKQIELELEIQQKEAEKLLFFISNLEILSDWLSWQVDKQEFLKKVEKTKKYFGIKAWVVEEKIPELKKIIAEENNNFLLKELSFSKNEQPPVIIENKGLAASFGIVTGVYGLPKKNELDPTPYLAPFFIFYFALALSDSGYGLLLIIFSLIAKKIFKTAGVEKFFNLFIFGGILTVIAGFFTGTVFGTDIGQSLRIIDPINDPIRMLIFVLLLGVFQIFVGLIIGMVWLIKRKKIKEAISGNGASIVFFIGGFLSFLFNNLIFLLMGLFFMVCLAIFYSIEKNIFSRIGKGFGVIYGLIGYFSDILSYSRILALGLATGIIAAVINMIALIFKDMIPIPGVNWLIAGIVIVFGHIGNLLINALGAFIHSARLQFVEFFSKFMEGGGRSFKPFIKNGRFIKIIN